MPFVPPDFTWSLGGLIALIVLIVCIVMLCIGQALTGLGLLIVLAALALARLT